VSGLLPMGAELPGELVLLDLLQIADRSFPTGSFVHSHGLEWLAKQPSFDLASVLQMRVHEQLVRFELPFLIKSYTLEAVELDARFHAMLLPRESREASLQVGRQFLRNARDLFPALAECDQADRLPYGHYPIAFGIVAHALGIAAPSAALVYAFQSVRGQISAAQRLTRLGQTEAQRLLHGLKPALRDAVQQALAYPIEEAIPFMPLLDIASMAHERAAVRLFVS
jgi:urease accessory protein